MGECDSTPLVLEVREFVMTLTGVCLGDPHTPSRGACARKSDFPDQTEALEWATQHAMQFPGHSVRIQSMTRHYFRAMPKRVEGP